jgi:hypothetical protein
MYGYNAELNWVWIREAQKQIIKSEQQQAVLMGLAKPFNRVGSLEGKAGKF